MLLFIAQIILHCICHFLISKHLMLLFITNNQITVKLGDKFQNISCYCLSIAVLSKVWYSKYFKTSHVIVYHYTVLDLFSVRYISKHLMLLFIPGISAFFSFSPPLFPLIFSIFLHFLPANTLILDRSTYHPINLLIFQAFLDFSFFFRLVKIL